MSLGDSFGRMDGEGSPVAAAAQRIQGIAQHAGEGAADAAVASVSAAVHGAERSLMQPKFVCAGAIAAVGAGGLVCLEGPGAVIGMGGTWLTWSLSWGWTAVRWSGWLAGCGAAAAGGYLYANNRNAQQQQDKSERAKREREGMETVARRKLALEEARDCGALPDEFYQKLRTQCGKDSRIAQLGATFSKEDEGEAMKWFTDMFKEMWPGICEHVRDQVISAKMEPMLRAKLGKSLRFKKKDLGTAYPTWGPIKSVVRDTERGRGVEWTIGFNYEGNCEIIVEIGPITVGVSDFSIVGTMVWIWRPFQKAMPFMGGMEMTFLNKPDITLNFRGIGSMMEIPGLKDVAIASVEQGFCGSMVLPVRMAFPVDWTGKVDKCQLRAPPPEGMLRVTILKATGLEAADMAVFSQATSDPYVEVTVGDETRKTPTIMKTLDPQWTEDNVFEFSVYSPEQYVIIKVWDWDQMSAHDLLGSIKYEDKETLHWYSVKNLLKGQHQLDHTLNLDNGESKGTLQFRVEWFDYFFPYNAHRPDKYNLETASKTVAAADPKGFTLPERSIITSAKYGKRDVRGALMEKLLANNGTVPGPLRSVFGGSDPADALDVEHIEPLDGPNVGLLQLRLHHVEGHSEEQTEALDQCYKIKVVIEGASGDRAEIEARDSWWGWQPNDGPHTIVAQNVERQALALLGCDMQSTGALEHTVSDREYEDAAASVGISTKLLKELFDPQTGVRVKHEKAQVLFRQRLARAKRDGATSEANLRDIEAETKKIRDDWDKQCNHERNQRRKLAEPQFEQCMYFQLPQDWAAVRLMLTDKDNKHEAGLRFPSCASGGCLSNGGVARSKGGTHGVYEILDGDGKVVDTVKDVPVGGRILGSFPLAVPHNKTKDAMKSPRRMRDAVQAKMRQVHREHAHTEEKYPCQLFGSLHVMACGRKVRAGSTATGRQSSRSVEELQGHDLYPLFGPEYSELYMEKAIQEGYTARDLKLMRPTALLTTLDCLNIIIEEHRQAIMGLIALAELPGSDAKPGLARRAVTVQILGGKQLIQQDSAVFGQGSSDPFVTVKYRGEKEETPVVTKDINPRWVTGNRWTFPFTSVGDKLEVLVEDHDMIGAPDFMGYLSVTPADLHGRGPQWHKLTVRPGNDEDMAVLRAKGGAADAPLGYIEVCVSVEDGGDPRLVEGLAGCITSRPRLVQLFKSIDENGDGKLTRSELVMGLRNDPEVAELLELPRHLRQNSVGHRAFNEFFQDADKSGHHALSEEEFVGAILRCKEASSANSVLYARGDQVWYQHPSSPERRRAWVIECDTSASPPSYVVRFDSGGGQQAAEGTFLTACTERQPPGKPTNGTPKPVRRAPGSGAGVATPTRRKLMMRSFTPTPGNTPVSSPAPAVHPFPGAGAGYPASAGARSVSSSVPRAAPFVSGQPATPRDR